MVLNKNINATNCIGSVLLSFYFLSQFLLLFIFHSCLFFEQPRLSFLLDFLMDEFGELSARQMRVLPLWFLTLIIFNLLNILASLSYVTICNWMGFFQWTLWNKYFFITGGQMMKRPFNACFIPGVPFQAINL